MFRWFRSKPVSSPVVKEDDFIEITTTSTVEPAQVQQSQEDLTDNHRIERGPIESTEYIESLEPDYPLEDTKPLSLLLQDSTGNTAEFCDPIVRQESPNTDLELCYELEEIPTSQENLLADNEHPGYSSITPDPVEELVRTFEDFIQRILNVSDAVSQQTCDDACYISEQVVRRCSESIVRLTSEISDRIHNVSESESRRISDHLATMQLPCGSPTMTQEKEHQE